MSNRSARWGACAALAMMLALAACGGDEDAGDTGDPSAPSATQAPETPDSEEPVTDGAEATATTAAAAPDTTDTDTPMVEPSGTLVIAVNQEPQDLAAQGTYKEINAPGLRNVVETLIAVDPSGEIVPVLATSWEWVDDRTISFDLREGVTFHDGTALDAEAAATAVNWVWSNDNAFTIQEFAGPGEITATATGPMTVEITEAEADPLLEWRLTLNGITSADQIANDPGSHFDTPIGTGPYVFEEWARGQYWSATTNHDWWGWTADDVYGSTLPLFENLQFVFRPEDATRAAMAQTGEAQLAMFPSAEECAAAGGDYKCVAGPSDTYLYGRLDHSLFADPRLQDSRVRQAIFESIDYEALVDLIGLASVPDGQLGAAGSVGFSSDISQYPYDPDNARRLLDEARADGVDVDGMQIDIIGRDTTPRISPIVEATGGFFTEIGLNNTVAVQVPDIFNPQVRIAAYAENPGRQLLQIHVKGNPSGDYGLTLFSNYACPDIDNPTGPSRSSVFCDEKFDADLLEALTLTGADRDAALAELVTFVHDEYLIIPLALLDRGYLLDSGLNFEFGIDHRVMAVYISSAS